MPERKPDDGSGSPITGSPSGSGIKELLLMGADNEWPGITGLFFKWPQLVPLVVVDQFPSVHR